MPELDHDSLWREIDGLEQRMGARLQEFKNRNELAQLRGQLTRLAQRHRNLRQRFEAADGPAWESEKDDLCREHGDLLEEFVRFEQKLDRNQRQQPGRTPGAKSGLV